MVENAPSAIDLQEFQFKLHSKLKIFDNTDDSKFKNSYNLVAAASRYGLVFVGSSNSTLEVIQLKSIENCTVTKVESTNFPKRCIPLPAIASHLTLNCDQTLLAVVCYKNDCATAIVYNVASFLSQDVMMCKEIRLSATPGVQVLEAGWNPTIPGTLTACKADGSLGVYNITENSVDINELPVAAAARCFCWSPKGKQLVVGSSNGSLTQYKPDLKAVKVIPAPPLGTTGPYSVLAVCWVSNYQFAAVYKGTVNGEARQSIVMVNAPKTGPTAYINYDDVCYSYGTLRAPQYYIIHQPTWGVIIVTSANSMEVGVLGLTTPTEPALWTQWNQLDAARAELPLSAAHQETFPVGVALDTGAMLRLPWGESSTLPPMPYLHLLSHHGVLCSFSVINTKQGAQELCSPPEVLPEMPGLFVMPPIQQLTPPNQQMTAPNQQISAANQQISAPNQQISMPNQQINAPNQQMAAVSHQLTAPSQQMPILSQQLAAPSQQMTALSQQMSAPNQQVSAPIQQVSTPNQQMGIQVSAPNLQMSAPNLQPVAPAVHSVAPTVQPVAPSIQMKPQIPASTPAILPISSAAPFGSLAFGSKFGAPSSFSAVNLATSSAPAAPGALPGWNAGSSLFGVAPGASTFGNLAMSQPQVQPVATSGFSFTLAGNTTNSNIVQTVQAPITSTNTSNIFGGAAVTPIASTKASTPILNVPKPNMSAPQNVTITSSKPLLSTPKPTKPDINTSQIIPEVKKDETVINDQMMQSLIKDEMKNFQSELQELFVRFKNIKLDVGSEEEKTNLVLTTDSLLEFYKELQETTDSQVAEVHYLKQALMQSFAWFEDTKARHRRYTDPNFASLLQSQELDPISEKQLADIKHLIYYIEAQLKQVDSFLDNQWSDFQDSCKKQVKGRLQIPTLEPIYQSLVRQNAILDRQKYVLKDISARIKSRNKKSTAYPNIINLTTNKTIEIDEELRKLKLDHGEIFSAKYDKVLTQENKFSEMKQSKLCSFFTNRNVIHISPKKPKFVNTLFNTPSKFPTSPIQRNLAQTFNKMDSPFNNSVEANMSASNLFSFSLLDTHSTKLPSPEKPKTAASLLFNSPKPSNQIFNFTAISTATTQSKPYFGSGDGQSLYSGAKTTQLTKSDIKQPELIKPSEIKKSEPSLFNLPEPKTTQPFTFTVPKPSTTLAKPGGFFDNSTISSSVKPNPTTTSNTFGSRDSIEPGFSFNALSLGQQSTPKPKTSNASPINFATTTIKPVTTQTTQISTPKPSFAIVQPSTTQKSDPTTPTTTTSIFGGLAKTSAFGFTTISGSSPFAQTPTTPTTPGTFFGATTPTTISGSFFAAKPTTATTIGSIFGATTPTITTTTTTKSNAGGFSFTQAVGDTLKTSSNIFGGAAVSTPINSTTTATTSATTTTISSPASSFSFLQASNTTIIPTTPKPDSTVAKVETPTTPKVDSTTATTQSSFNFGTLASNIATTTAGNSFSFGNLTINALSPSTASSTPTTLTTPPTVAAPATLPTPTTLAAPTTLPTPTTSPIPTTPSNGNVVGFSFALTGTNTTTTYIPTPSAPAIVATPTTSSTVGATSTTPASTAAFGVTSASGTAFGAAPATSTTFGAATTSASSLGAVTSTTPSFGAPVTSTAASYGATTPSSTSFGTTTAFAAPASTTDTGFGAATSTTGFGAPVVTTASAFGAPTTSTSSFGSVSSTSTGFGAAVATTAAAFGAATTPTAGFGAATTSATNFEGFGASLFGKPPVATTTTTSSFLGQPICSPSSFTQTQNTSVFGQNTGNIFAQKPGTPSSTTGNIFGQSSGSIFGQTSPAVSSASSTNIFGQTQSSPFGAPITTSPPIFGQSATSSGSIFGQSNFGSPAAATSSSNFSFTQNTSSFGASGGSIFGAKPAFAATPAFGAPPAFGGPPAFGANPTTGNVFGSPAPNTQANTFGGGFSSPSAFGQKPSFGTPPGFGQSAFGSPPAFGSSPQFGSPQRVFGSPNAAPPTSTFGAGVQENSTFANLANQSTIGFGSLVQSQPTQQQQQPPPQFSGGAQFSSWR